MLAEPSERGINVEAERVSSSSRLPTSEAAKVADKRQRRIVQNNIVGLCEWCMGEYGGGIERAERKERSFKAQVTLYTSKAPG